MIDIEKGIYGTAEEWYSAMSDPTNQHYSEWQAVRAKRLEKHGVDPMAGRRGISHDEAQAIIRLCAAQAGLKADNFDPLGWSILHRVANAAHKASAQGMREIQVAWAVSCWHAEVANRSVVNVHRRTLDDTWRQVIRHFGGDPDTLLGPDHALLAAHDLVDLGSDVPFRNVENAR